MLNKRLNFLNSESSETPEDNPSTFDTYKKELESKNNKETNKKKPVIPVGNEDKFTPEDVLNIFKAQKEADAELNKVEVPVVTAEPEPIVDKAPEEKQKTDDAIKNNVESIKDSTDFEPTEEKTPGEKQKEEALTALKAVKDYSIAGDLSYEGMMALLSKIEVVTDNTNNDMLSPNTRDFLLLEKGELIKKMEALSDEVTAKVLSETPKSIKSVEEIKDNNEDSQFKLPKIDSVAVNSNGDEKIDITELEKNTEVAPLSLKDVKDITTGGSIKVSPVVSELPDIDIDKILNPSITVEKSVIPPKIEENKVKKLEMIDEAIKENSIFDLERKNFMISKSALEIFNRPSYISESKVEKTKFIYKTPKDTDFGFDFFKNSVDVKLRDVIDKAEKLGYVLCPLSEVLEIFNKIEKPKKGKRLFPATKPIYDFKGNKVYFADINYEVGKNTIDTINYDYVLKGDETLLFIEKNK